MADGGNKDGTESEHGFRNLGIIEKLDVLSPAPGYDLDVAFVVMNDLVYDLVPESNIPPEIGGSENR